MSHLFCFLIFLLSIISPIQSQTPGPEPTPEPTPTPSPEPHPEPTPEPTPLPPTPNPQQPPAPQPPAPQPPSPTPHPSPSPMPAAPSIHDYYFYSVFRQNNYTGSYGGAVALTGANDTLTLFGQNTASGMSEDVYRFKFVAGTWQATYFSAWNPAKQVLAYSQPPPDATSSYRTYYFWKNSTHNEYTLSFFDGNTNHTDVTSNFTVPIGNEDFTIAATKNGWTYVYLSGSTEVWVVNNNSPISKTIFSNNETNMPVPRFNPAIVGYQNGFFLQGGTDVENGEVLSDLWFYDSNAWSKISGNINLQTAGHSAFISILPSPTGGDTNVTIYFINLSATYLDRNISLVSFDYVKNQTYYHYNLTLRTGSLVAVFGNQFFYYGGQQSAFPTNEYHTDLWQFVDENFCTSVADCEVCVNVYECGWCSSTFSGAPNCVAGNEDGPVVQQAWAGYSTCNNDVLLNQVENCPEEFPSWAIALIVIGGVILVGGIVFGIMKLRSGKPGYEPVG